jgi:hypothetical protein
VTAQPGEPATKLPESRSAYMIDARVHEGVLWRLARLRRQHPEHVIVPADVWKGLPQ